MHPGWFARNCELMTLGQFSHVMNSRHSLGPPLTIRPARWVGLCSRLKAPLRSIRHPSRLDDTGRSAPSRLNVTEQPADGLVRPRKIRTNCGRLRELSQPLDARVKD